MERRVIAGSAVTALTVVGAVTASSVAARDLLAIVLLAGVGGGLVAGGLSREPGHVGAGARAGGYGGATGFLAFVVVGSAQSVLGGDLTALFLGFETLIVALLVVPLHALSGAIAAAVGVRLRDVADHETAL